MFADAGIPMLFIQLPYLAILFLPVIAVESFVTWKRLRISFGQVLSGTVRANFISTFIGFPLAWLALVVLEMFLGGGSAWGLKTPAARLAAVTLQAPWLIPYESELYWMIPAASLVLLIPAFPVSVWVEGRCLRRRWTTIDGKRLWQTVWLANAVSYAILFTLAGIHLYVVLKYGKATPYYIP